MMYAQVHPAVSMHIEDTMYSMWVVGVMSPYPMLVSVIRLQWRHTTYLGEEGGVGVVSTSMEESRTIEGVFYTMISSLPQHITYTKAYSKGHETLSMVRSKRVISSLSLLCTVERTTLPVERRGTRGHRPRMWPSLT